jgi:hypothetical protein
VREISSFDRDAVQSASRFFALRPCQFARIIAEKCRVHALAQPASPNSISLYKGRAQDCFRDTPSPDVPQAGFRKHGLSRADGERNWNRRRSGRYFRSQSVRVGPAIQFDRREQIDRRVDVI